MHSHPLDIKLCTSLAVAEENFITNKFEKDLE